MMKRVKRVAAALLAACLVVSLLPVGAAAAETNIEDLVNSAASGAVITLQEDAIVPQASGDGNGEMPWIISNNVTIDGNGHMITIRRGGILLDADVTFKNTTLYFTTSTRNAIIANGHKLTLESVSPIRPAAGDIPRLEGYSFNVFGGGLIKYESGGEVFTVPDPGSAGEIIIKGNTYLQGNSGTLGSGNIYAGSLSMGSMNPDVNADGAATTFPHDVKICIEDHGDPGGVVPPLGKIYAGGAQQRNPFGMPGQKVTSPDDAKYRVSGTVTVSGAKIPDVDGIGAAVTNVEYAGNTIEVSRVLQNISNLKVNSGSLALNQGSSFRDNAAVSVASGAALNIKALNDVTIGNFTGGGSLVLWAIQNLHTLTISGTVTGKTAVYTGNMQQTSLESRTKEGHVYIKTPASTSETAFTLKPYSAQPDMKLVKDTDGNWTALDEGAGGDTDLVDRFQFVNKTASVSAGEEAEFEMEAYLANNDYTYLDSTPLTIDVDLKQLNIGTDPDGLYDYIYTDVLGNFRAYVADNKLSITADEPGSHSIKVTLPTNATVGGKILTDTVMLTVTDNSTLPDTDKPIPVPEAKKNLKYTGSEQTGVPEGPGYTIINHKATNAGAYTAKATPNDGYQWTDGTKGTVEIPWRIEKAAGPTAPSNLLGIPPTAAGAKDGKITGTKAEMEYAANAEFNGAQNCTGTEITGLTPGTYYVRVKETATHEAGAYATVKVPEAGQPIAVPIPTANTGLKWTGKEQVGVPEGTGYTLTGNKATDAGSYTATAALASGYQWSDGSATPKTIPWTIAKGEAPAAPTGLKGIAPTSAGGANGKITGTTAAMQYAAKADFTNAKDCAAGETTGLASGSYYVRFKETNNHPAGLAAEVTVPKYDGGGDSGSSGGGSTGGGDIQEPVTTPQQTANAINAANSGSTVTMTLPSGNTVSRTVWQALAGKDVTLEIETGRFTWSVDGRDVDSKALPTSLNLGAKEGMDLIPASVLEQTPRGTETLQISLNHNGAFAVPLTLSVDLGRDNAQRWANLYYYNTTAKTMEFQSASLIGDNGRAAFPMDHASSYAVVVDRVSHGSEGGDDPFLDVSLGAWYYDVVRYVYQKGLMTGTGRDTFSPLSLVTRAQAVTTLHRMAGSPAARGAGSFRDVAAGSYYADAVAWAVEKGVATGHSADRFAPDAPITREQLAALLCRYARVVEGENVNVSAQVLLRFPDQGRVSAYAVQPMGWAVEKGLIDGFQDGSLQPQGQANRAQLAAILSRFAER